MTQPAFPQAAFYINLFPKISLMSVFHSQVHREAPELLEGGTYSVLCVSMV